MNYSTAYVVQLNRKGKPWQARLKFKDEKGNWKEKSKLLPEAKGKKEAQRLADAWLDEMNKQAEMELQEQLKLADEKNKLSSVYENYLSMQYSAGALQRSTYVNNLYYYKEYIKPYLGDKNFFSIDREDINDWLTELYKKGLTDNTKHTIYARLKKVFNYYIKIGELNKDPFFGVIAPKKGEPKVSYLTKDQMDKVLASVYADFDPKDPMFAGVLLAYYAGLRRGEVLGLRWQDVDFDTQMISVRSAVTVGGKEGAYTKGPKNKSSIRTFPMVSQLKEALEERKKAIKPELNWFVCGNKDKFIAPQTFSHAFTDFTKRNNLIDANKKRLVPHALRHNFATVGINANMDIASLSLMMGHSSRAMTLDTYGASSPDALAKASVKLGEQFKTSSALEQDFEEYKREMEEQSKKELGKQDETEIIN